MDEMLNLCISMSPYPDLLIQLCISKFYLNFFLISNTCIYFTKVLDVAIEKIYQSAIQSQK
ncbi:hypothetical protein ALC53_08451 [Atta colombica]|uniref:Uncharacterized protein n=1 Tax=Atta colombica TaxID=520822 RepID=A0A195BA88_9HYME|nr:hypothetical protein ALC53_08451 [Atta colombica]